MRVTVLGSAASHAGAGEACSGHLVECDGGRVLFDCGNGVLSNLYKVADPYRLDAVFITHNHPDHYVDLYSMQAMLRYAPEGPLERMPLFMPTGLFQRMQGLLSERGAAQFREAFELTELRDREPVHIGAMTVTPYAVNHTEPTFALVAQADGVRLCYTADTAPGPWVVAAARGADLMLAEATLPEPYAGASPHMTAAQAGALALEAGAGRLVLVHVWPTNDRTRMAAVAQSAFAGPVTVARELDSFEVTRKGTPS
ncbi:MAG: MBL fold metallo-hydrolase [Actinobacteria bacterium HGW-Actinobacteria-7]|jgi:ribonuclease BN (tRNA processing enzyme)|nr:MAG: MBL fold metallo-hydrolase [Actinobacteria bacterium HGW-Actinobacteria-7]